MKVKSVSSTLVTAVLAFLLSYGGIRCLITGFSLELSTDLLLYCTGFALAGSIAFRLRHGGAVAACLLALLGGYLWQQGLLARQTLQLCYEITSIYDQAYNFGYLGNPYSADSIALPLIVYSGLTALVSTWCITRRRTIVPALLISIVPLILCLVVTDTVPTMGSLFLLLFGLLLLLLTQSVHRRSDADGARLTWILSAPVALVLALLFLLIPQSTYDKQNQAEKLTSLFNRLPMVDISEDGELTLSFTREIPSQVNLQSIGPNTQFSLRVMEVTAEQSGRLYLRGKHFDTYTGTRWHNKPDDREAFPAPYLFAADDTIYYFEPKGTLSIRTFGTHSVKYLPYHPSEPHYLHSGALENLDGETEYDYQWCALPHNLEDYLIDTVDSIDTLDSNVHWENALQVPQATLEWAADYLRDTLFSQDIYDESVCAVANSIADLVRNSASYDLDTPRMPEGERDFARWFMEESNTGYCVHYATATVVLLRTAGIPARYVEGYMTDVVAGKTVSVTELDAHAWAEYYVTGIGWIPLESTAAASSSNRVETNPGQTSDGTDETAEDPQFDTLPQNTLATTTDKETAPSTKPAHGKDNSQLEIAPLFIVAGIVLLLVLQWPVRLHLRRTLQRTGSMNARALKKWAHASRLAHLLKQPLPDSLTELALRAKFSQHTLTPADLEVFDTYLSSSVAELRQKPWWQQLYFRLIWAAY